ncbi:MAG: LPS-assembly protein LptD, partial [Bacteroidota bacterium]|nr:LPS-assembly protein LptD [Bacteroidota bacterium]
GFAYVASTKNEINTADSTLFNRSSLDKFRNGMMQTASASTSMKLLKHFTLNPNVSYTERWYLQSIDKRFDAQSDSFITDTIIGPRRAGEANASANITTKVYGMYQFKRGPVQAIRHIITPSIGLSARPDMSTQIYGYFGQNGELSNYSPYEIGIYGAPPAAKQGLVNFGLLNNLEMKVRSEKDTITGFKKIKILENLSINTSYNVFAEEFHWTPLMISGRTTFLNNFSVVVGGTLDPYQLSNDSIPIKINELEWNNSRLVNADAALTFTLRSKQGRNPITTSTKGTEEQLRMIQNNPNAYVDFNIPWTLNVGYIFRYSKPTIEEQITQTLDLSGDFNLTPKWKFGFRTNYDFTKKEIAYASVDIYRDLHCWEMKFNWVPFGFNKSYNLTINVKAQVLQDLKLTRRSNPFDNRQM